MDRKNIQEVAWIHEDRVGKLGTRIIDFTTIGRRDLVDTTGLVGGIYINSAESVERGDFICNDNPQCISDLVSLESRIHMAIDSDNRVYPLPELSAEDPEIIDMLIETNLQILLCTKHKSGLIRKLEMPQNVEPAKVYLFPGTEQDSLIFVPNLIKHYFRQRMGKVIDMRKWKKQRSKPKKF